MPNSTRSRPALACILAAASLLPAVAARADDSADDAWFNANLPALLTLYRDLHSHPELSFHEVKTSAKVAQELKAAGLEVTTGVGKLGVVGILKNGEGPLVMVRTDLDALPVTEETGLPFASKQTSKNAAGQTVGVMHACGHDVHMSCLVGTARRLAAHRDDWKGTVMFIGQPAEEAIGGAEAMLADGLYERFGKPSAALALHCAPDLATGRVAYTSGPAMAGSTSVDVVVRGRGGHGAYPHTTVDPVVLAALLVLDLQTIVAREVNPIHPAVVTVGSIHGGFKHNIISNQVDLQLTLRSFQDSVDKQLVDAIKRRVKGLAEAHNAPAGSVTVVETTPPTVNTPTLVAKVLHALKRVCGDAGVELVEPAMGAEDFGLYGQGGVPTFMFRLGTIPPEKIADAKSKGESLPSLHSSKFQPDAAPSIRTGIRAMTAAVIELLPPASKP